MAHVAFNTIKTVLGPSQLLTLHSQPVLLVPGVANTIPYVLGVYFRYFYNTVPYNPGSQDTIVVYPNATPTSGSVPGATTYAKGFVDQTVDMSAWANPQFAGTGVGPVLYVASQLIGNGIYITQYNGTSWPNGSDWTQGNGSLAVFLKYEMIRF